MELFTSQSGITTLPSDELSANESEPDGRIFLKTMCLKVEEKRNFQQSSQRSVATSDVSLSDIPPNYHLEKEKKKLELQEEEGQTGLEILLTVL